jgi:Na+-transporting methylmalonyl-CoA/oxaloacetate decarboxylase gamma subunit
MTLITAFVAMLALGALVYAAGVAVVFCVVTALCFGTWVLALVRLCRIARFGRLASVVRASAAGLQVVVPASGRESHRQFAAAALGDIELVDRSAVHLMINSVLLRIVYRGGVSTELRIPCRRREPLEPVERRLREVLGLPPGRWT